MRAALFDLLNLKAAPGPAATTRMVLPTTVCSENAQVRSCHGRDRSDLPLQGPPDGGSFSDDEEVIRETLSGTEVRDLDTCVAWLESREFQKTSAETLVKAVEIAKQAIACKPSPLHNGDYVRFKRVLERVPSLASYACFKAYVVSKAYHSMIDLVFEVNGRRPFSFDAREVAHRREQLRYVVENDMMPPAPEPRV
jgi:hypothetical protein